MLAPAADRWRGLIEPSMDQRRDYAVPAAPGHALLAPIPLDSVLSRKQVASPEILATPHGAAIAGWEQLTVELSAGSAGLRHVMLILDAAGHPIAVSDTVLYRSTVSRISGGADVEFYQESLGGRIEQDGSFRGTRWRTVGVETDEEDEPRMESTPAAPSPADIAGIRALVAELLRRQPRTGT